MNSCWGCWSPLPAAAYAMATARAANQCLWNVHPESATVACYQSALRLSTEARRIRFIAPALGVATSVSRPYNYKKKSCC